MTPHEFRHKWRNVELKERSAAQSHFNDLCALLDILDPVAADPKGEWFTFEKGATKTSGGEGWADVWRKDCFAWEYKGRHKDLARARGQLLQYAAALDNPPLLIVSDMDRILIHTNWTNTVAKTWEITLDDLLDAGKRDLLKAAFLDPDRLKPTTTRQKLTEDAARDFAVIAQRLRDRGHDAEQVAEYLSRLVFCLFAEDANLLPNKIVQKMIERCRFHPHKFEGYARKLFGAMAHPGGELDIEEIEWFNGGLFDSDVALPLEADDIAVLINVARMDWSEIDPSIMGTLFERGLDPAKRSQLGAHYTDRDKIMMIIRPVIIEPLEAEWAAVRADIELALGERDRAEAAIQAIRDDVAAAVKADPDAAKAGEAARRKQIRALEAQKEEAVRKASELRAAFLNRLKAFRVLDPACGSGNFLYLALVALKDIEHKANIDAEALGLPRGTPQTGPENMLGIELNVFAAKLARVSVWVGEIQWMRRNGFEAGRNPVLRPLDTIECRDAILAPDGTRAEWPKANVVVGNPPFLGASRMISEIGEEEVALIRRAWDNIVPGFSDLVCFWFAKAWIQVCNGQATRVGLVATNSIRGGVNRAVLSPISESGKLHSAWSDEPWTVDGAAVRVSLICFGSHFVGPSKLNGTPTDTINSDLSSAEFDLTKAAPLESNQAVAFLGTKKGGPFDIPAADARRMLLLPTNPNGKRNCEVLFNRTTGGDLARRRADRWVIDFGPDMDARAAMLFEAPFEWVLKYVKPVRDKNRRDARRLGFWLHSETAPGLRRSIAGLSRFIATPRVSKFRTFVFLGHGTSVDDGAIAIARDDDTTFGILHSRFHELWALRMGSSLEDRPRYTPTTTFETFPFPAGLTPDIPAKDYSDDPRAQKIAAAAAELDARREAWLNPPDLVSRVPEVVPGYPDRIIPRSEEAAKALKSRTLTHLYNTRPEWLARLHRDLDEAVAEAYGWGDDWRAGKLDDETILARLFALNQQRAGKG
jgi:type II restriction/modification system DNA methylase subunit YeeA